MIFEILVCVGAVEKQSVRHDLPDTRLQQEQQLVAAPLSLDRTSPQYTVSRPQDLLRSALPDSMESALGGDERCVLDTMRLVDLLLVLLFEGRKALPKSTAGSTGRIPGLRRLDSSGERSHRQLIDCIRSKDTDALIDAIDTGGTEGTGFCWESDYIVHISITLYLHTCLSTVYPAACPSRFVKTLNHIQKYLKALCTFWKKILTKLDHERRSRINDDIQPTIQFDILLSLFFSVLKELSDFGDVLYVFHGH